MSALAMSAATWRETVLRPMGHRRLIAPRGCWRTRSSWTSSNSRTRVSGRGTSRQCFGAALESPESDCPVLKVDVRETRGESLRDTAAGVDKGGGQGADAGVRTDARRGEDAPALVLGDVLAAEGRDESVFVGGGEHQEMFQGDRKPIVVLYESVPERASSGGFAFRADVSLTARSPLRPLESSSAGTTLRSPSAIEAIEVGSTPRSATPWPSLNGAPPGDLRWGQAGAGGLRRIPSAAASRSRGR